MTQNYRDNKLKTKKDVQKLLCDMLEALKPYYSEGGAFLNLGVSSTYYSQKISYLEGFARPLFGMCPLAYGGGKTDMWEIYTRGIINGTDPESSEYWGEVTAGQAVVEMTTLGLALIMVPEYVWEPLTDIQKSNFEKWLYQINNCPLKANNWVFFTVLVNLGLKRVGAAYSQEMIEKNLAVVEDCYVKNGWYTDGKNTEQADYYIAFAMHYYGLLYAKFMKDEDPERAGRFLQRAEIFAKDFVCWFASDGAAVPFGRSLTYRFAMVAFFSALAFAGSNVFSPGELKGIILRNIRWWINKPIFSDNGYLTVGYCYPNRKMAEMYNALGSPNWAMKAFLILALDDNSEFWTCEEKERPKVPEISKQEVPHMLVCNEGDRPHSFILTSGQYCASLHEFSAAKYEKFAYSSIFGFSVPADCNTLVQGAYDSTLALSEHDGFFRTRLKCEYVEITDEYIKSIWKPWNDVQITTWLIPCVPFHIRIHKISSQRSLYAAEGGFSIGYVMGEEQITTYEDVDKAYVESKNALSYIENIKGDRVPQIIQPFGYTNIMHPYTKLPMLCGDIEKGDTTLACIVLGQPAAQSYALDKKPDVVLSYNSVKVYTGNFEKTILLD